MLKMLSGAGIMFVGIVLGYAMREASEAAPADTSTCRRAMADGLAAQMAGNGSLRY